MALIAVTDHAAERYRQRVRGTLDPRTEIATRVGEAWAAGRISPGPRRGSLDVRDRDLVFVCVEDKPRGELIVVTLWEEGGQPAVPRRERSGERNGDEREARGRKREARGSSDALER